MKRKGETNVITLSHLLREYRLRDGARARAQILPGGEQMHSGNGVDRSGNKPRILVLDDDDTILELVQDILSSEYEVIASSSAADGLKRLQQEHFDLLILDLGLPGLSGIDTIREIRESQESRLPILVVSAYTELRRLVSGLQVDSVLAKPFSLAQLETRVSELINSAHRGHSFAGAVAD